MHIFIENKLFIISSKPYVVLLIYCEWSKTIGSQVELVLQTNSSRPWREFVIRFKCINLLKCGLSMVGSIKGNIQEVLDDGWITMRCCLRTKSENTKLGIGEVKKQWVSLGLCVSTGPLVVCDKRFWNAIRPNELGEISVTPLKSQLCDVLGRMLRSLQRELQLSGKLISYTI